MDSNAAETRATGERSGFNKAAYLAACTGGRDIRRLYFTGTAAAAAMILSYLGTMMLTV